MKRHSLVIGTVLLAAALALVGCARQGAEELNEPATVTRIKGTAYNQVKLNDVAYRNLGIQTRAVRAETASSTAGAGSVRRLIIPMSALIFDSNGNPYAYTNPAPKTYVRAPLVIDVYRGSDVVLRSGPPVGTQVVTVGDPELFGIEYGVGGE